jgi:monoterpene epsilon-lactone hydrolase
VSPVRQVPVPVARALLHPGFRCTLNHRLPWSWQRMLLDGLSRFQPLAAGSTVRELSLGGRPAELITGGPADPEPSAGAVLYLHGGGYTVGSLATHRSVASHLAAALGRPVYLLDYRLAPEHPVPAALADALAAFEALTGRHGYAPASVALAGDSAGGGIALAAAQSLVAAGAPGPGALALISPWVDPNVVAQRRRDTVVSQRWGFACGAAYLGAGDRADPRYAPLLGSMAGLPPTYLTTSTRELLYPQCLRLAVLLRRAGVRFRYVESSTLWHAAPVQAGMFEAAAESVRDIAAFLTVLAQAPGPTVGAMLDSTSVPDLRRP